MGSGFVIAPALRAQETTIEDALAPFRAQLEDPLVTDVFVNGARGMFVDRGSGIEPVPEWSASEREVRELAAELIAQGGRHVDDAHPCVDVRLRGGIRVHAVLAPIATAGTTLSIRIPRFAATTLATLVEQGMIDHSLEVFLRHAVARRANLLVSGAAGVGKTTLLSALLGEAPPIERIVTIEDVAEIALGHPHHVALESRQANLEGAGEVGLARLVREALRMKPDRLVIGECRGAEVRELLSALNTGHDGGAGTVHANSLADVATRLEALGALAGLDETTLARQVTSAIEFVIHLERDADGRRRVAAVGEFRIVDGRLFVVPKEVPQIAAPVPTRRSRRRAGGSTQTPSSASVGSAAGAAATRTASVVGTDRMVSGPREPAAIVVTGSGSSSAFGQSFVPPRAYAADPDPADVDDDRPARDVVARSHFTADGDWHRVATVRSGLQAQGVPVSKPTREAAPAGAPAADTRFSDIDEPDSASGANESRQRRRTVTSAAAFLPDAAMGVPAASGVSPTFGEWRERLRVSPRRPAPAAGDRSRGAGAASETAPAQSPVVPHSGAVRPSRAPEDNAARPVSDEDHAWSEASMRAQRVPREAPALTSAELDAQWSRLVAGWETNDNAPEPSAPSGQAPQARARDRRDGAAWTFVPEPPTPPATRSKSDAGR